jgi:glyoxylase-like metal-dependent hydrolase (beta-lactamase superfamily II)
MERITPDIYQLPLPLNEDTGGDYVNAYVIRMDHGCLLVDTGLDSEVSYKSLTDQLAEIGYTPQDIKLIVATHIHLDHYGLAEKLRQESKAPIALHTREAARVKTYSGTAGIVQKQLDWLSHNGVPDRVLEQIKRVRTTPTEIIASVAPAVPDILLADGEIIRAGRLAFRVISTPGHSSGHISLHESDLKILIGGDLILSDANTFVSCEVNNKSNSLSEYIDSLNEIKGLDIDLVLPGHGPVFEEFSERVNDTLLRLELRSDEVLKAIRHEAKTGYVVSGEINRTRNGRTVELDELPPVLHLVSVMKTLAHLKSLMFQGKVNKFDSNGMAYYQAVVYSEPPTRSMIAVCSRGELRGAFQEEISSPALSWLRYILSALQ